MTPEQQIHRASRAREVLENEAFIDAFAQLEQEIHNQWSNSPARDAAGREKLYMLLGLSRKLKGILENTMNSGKLAQKELEYRQSLRDRLGNFWSDD